MKVIVEGDEKKIEILKKRFRSFDLTFTDFKEKKQEVKDPVKEESKEDRPKRGRKKND